MKRLLPLLLLPLLLNPAVPVIWYASGAVRALK
ncbi:hypothetical protein SAMN05421553_3787 [Pseudomonas anguilliseptica]|uniref:Uncharacterized protein n=1 Tax=Pseudomonas anguilliseptica TaxID=53406 RepID=A0A1H5F5S0_PSEAG|nr:hypothetical protein SAMN05421553_3787 [Pseudomonas anguilliseptica]